MARVGLGDVSQFLAVAGLSIAVGMGCTFESDGDPGPVEAPSFDYDDIVGDDGATFEADTGELATAPQPAAPEIVAFAINPSGIAVDGSGLFWTDASTTWNLPSSIMRHTATGPSAVELSSHYGYPVGLVVHQGRDALYWADPQWGAIFGTSSVGGDPVMVVSGLRAPYAMVADAGALYWTDVDAGTIMSYDVYNGAVTLLAKGQSVPTAIAVGPTTVIWVDLGSGSIRAVPKLGGSWMTLTTRRSLSGLAVDNNYIYFGDVGDQTISRLSMADGSVEVIAEDQVDPGAMAVYGRSLTWTTGEYGMINEMRIEGGPVRVIASQQDEPDFLVANSGTLYWASVGDGAVWRAGLAF